MAYKLDLSESSNIHATFHVSCLKKVVGPNFRVQTTLPKLDEEGSILLQPETISHTQEQHFCKHAIKDFLAQWKDTPPEDVTWEPVSILQ